MENVKKIRLNDITGDLSGLTPELVSQYLRHNPEVLDQHVSHHVSSEQIEKWLHTKTDSTPSTSHGKGTTNKGEDSTKKGIDLTAWRKHLHTIKSRILREMAADIELKQGRLKLAVLSELAESVASLISADCYTLFSNDPSHQTIATVSKRNKEFTLEAAEATKDSKSLAALVAKNNNTRCVDFNETRTNSDRPTVSQEKAKCAMGVPVTDDADLCIGVVEFYKFSKAGHFTEEIERDTLSLLQWYSTLVEYLESENCAMRQRQMSDYLLEVTKSIFMDIVSIDVVIMKIMNFAQQLVNADRASLFLVDNWTNELYARIFDVGDSFTVNDEGLLFDSDVNLMNIPSRSEEEPVQEIRFSMTKGIAGYVATTGKNLNIKEAYKDKRFNPEVDAMTGYKTETILCMPIFIKGTVIGVVQMVNKRSGYFTKSDEEAFEMFAIYCGLALYHAKLYERIRRSEQKYKVALDVLSYFNVTTSEEFEAVKKKPIPDKIGEILRYDFSPWALTYDNKAIYVLYMFRSLFSQINPSSQMYDMDDLIRFTLTVRKNYRNVPYHNWSHAFSVAQSMFTLVQTTKHQLTPTDCVSLFVACLCHDLDHRGKTNSFMVKSASPLSAIYTTSTMEHHHFNQTVTILQNEGHNIFKFFSATEYKQILSEIKSSILATDLAVFFKHQKTYKDVLDDDKFSWDILHHKNLLVSIMMTGCDLCAMFKPWKIQKELVYIIMEEFWQQGDEEKQKGLKPMEMMDREKSDDLPSLEVGFIESICVPCYELLNRSLPETSPMLAGAISNLTRWKQLARSKSTKID